MLLPDFDDNGNLPPGIHRTTWSEFRTRFGTTPYRLKLIEGLLAALRILQSVGCKCVYIDGSFVTTKKAPGDFDALWDAQGVDIPSLIRIEPLFFDLSNHRAAQKAKYLGEFFPASTKESSTGRTFLEFFQTDKTTGDAKGIVALDLRGLP